MKVAVATTSTLAAEAAAEIADAGGNAVDCAIAAAMLTMNTQPGVCALAGGAYVMTWACSTRSRRSRASAGGPPSTAAYASSTRLTPPSPMACVPSWNPAASSGRIVSTSVLCEYCGKPRVLGRSL